MLQPDGALRGRVAVKVTPSAGNKDEIAHHKILVSPNILLIMTAPSDHDFQPRKTGWTAGLTAGLTA